MTLKAPAKINLYLEVLRARPDGYHDIRSVMVPVSLCDGVTLSRTDEVIETVVESRGVPGADMVRGLDSRDNLATRAAMALKKECRYRGGARIRIEKKIPVGGGLGGGSTDAAAALRGLNALWGLNLPMERLKEIGFQVGCDIPALVQCGPVRVEGLGERVAPIDGSSDGHTRRKKNSWWLVIVNPGFSVSTGDIYSRHTSSSTLTSGRAGYKNIISAVEKWDLDEVARHLFNDLQATVFKKYPLIEMVAERLEKAGAIGVLVSGSGGSVFGLARRREEAQGIWRRFRRNSGFPVWCKVVKTLPDGVMVAHGPLEARV